MDEKQEEIVLIKIVQKIVNGRLGVDVQFLAETLDIGTLIDLGAYFTNLGRNQRITTNPNEEVVPEENGAEKKQRVYKPKPVRD